MIILISKDKTTQYNFFKYCKAEGKDCMILESLYQVIACAEVYINSFVIIDYNNIDKEEVIIYLKLKELGNKTFYEINIESGIKNLYDALAVVSYEEKRTFRKKFEQSELDKIIEEVIKKYDFKKDYKGYKYLLNICKFYILSNCENIYYCKCVDSISKEFKTNNSIIEKNIRYIIYINKNDIITKIRGENSKVKAKAVIQYLTDEIIKIMPNHLRYNYLSGA